MAKRELSSTLRNLKFMQRATQREEQPKKEEEIQTAGNFPPGIKNKCVVVTEGDPHPGAVKGRMSFQSFNPSIDKLNEAATNGSQPEARDSSGADQNGKLSHKETRPLTNEAQCSNDDKLNNEATGDHKRKQPEEVLETPCPNKSLIHGDQHSSPNNRKDTFKQPRKFNKLDWNLLRRSKSQNETDKHR